MSVFFHLFLNGGNPEGLFRAGIMNSGSSTPTGHVTELQSTYNFVVEQVGCTNATDTLQCLRTVPVESLVAAVNQTPNEMDIKVGVCVHPMLRRRRVDTSSLGPRDSVFPSSRWCLRHEAPSAACSPWSDGKCACHHRYASRPGTWVWYLNTDVDSR